jgi:hypothetical protein
MSTLYEAYVGIDVGKAAHRACAVDAVGEVLFNVAVAANVKQFFLGKVRTSSYPLVSRLFQRLVSTFPFPLVKIFPL